VAAAQRIYARALYEAARDHDRVEPVAADLAALSHAIEASDELAGFLDNPQVEPATKADVLGQVAEGADEFVHNFVRVVAVKGRAGELPRITEEFQALVDEAAGRVAVELTTAYALPEEEATAIVRKIEQASGRTVDASRKVDPSLIGGIVLQAGSLRVDASVRGRLDRLRRELVSAR
jgi:F-type H+-transporting ATPase subunit delta